MLPGDGFGGNPSNPHLATNSEETFTGSEQHLQAYTAKCGQRQISFSTILRNKWYHVKVQEENFHLNGHIIGFRP